MQQSASIVIGCSVCTGSQGNDEVSMCINAGERAMRARTMFPMEDCEVVVERDEKNNPSYSLLFSSKAAINLWGAAHAGIRCACIARV